MLAQVSQDKASLWEQVRIDPCELFSRDVTFLEQDLEKLILEVEDMRCRMSVYQSPDAPFDLVIENLESLRGRNITYGDYVDSCAQYLYAICCAQWPHAEIGDKSRLYFLEHIPHRQSGNEFYIGLDDHRDINSIAQEIEISKSELRKLAVSILNGNYYDGEKSGLLVPIVTSEGLDFEAMNRFDSAGCLVVELIPWRDSRFADGDRIGPIGHFLHDIQQTLDFLRFPEWQSNQ